MKISISSPPNSRPSQSAFSLIELLAVIAIAAILMSASLALTPGLLRANRFSQNLLQVSATLDHARQHAIAQNTYVWVAFATPAPNQTWMAVLESKEGTDTFAWKTDPTALSTISGMAPLGKLRRLEDVILPDPEEEAADPQGNIARLEPIDLDIQHGEQDLNFTQAILFSPTGEAKVKAKAGHIQFEVARPNDEKNAATVRIAGITGKVSVLRPD